MGVDKTVFLLKIVQYFQGKKHFTLFILFLTLDSVHIHKA